MKKSTLLGLAIILTVSAAGAARADDKYIDCVDPDVGKSCMECANGGPQVCCPKHGTCTVNKLSDDTTFTPTACLVPHSQEPEIPMSEATEQHS